MKALAFLLVTACVFAGCAAHKPEGNRAAPFSELLTPPESTLPQPAITLQAEAGPWIHVAGDFKNPGRYDWTNGITLTDAIAASGGFTKFASHRLRLQHRDATVEHYVFRNGATLRYSQGACTTNNPALRAGDFLSTTRDL
jgi:protein involved in polysaccharide export with SLBB domain